MNNSSEKHPMLRIRADQLGILRDDAVRRRARELIERYTVSARLALSEGREQPPAVKDVRAAVTTVVERGVTGEAEVHGYVALAEAEAFPVERGDAACCFLAYLDDTDVTDPGERVRRLLLAAEERRVIAEENRRVEAAFLSRRPASGGTS
ncbi:hypothetical protein A176_000025 [Myxococcus hansupus]|uniref:Uncharacterized protein n=1 Tax=Pseudomyxococcus hansupus TaxID=1297742 RepID=A0A0H4WNH3_9BACT|nr:hypothetical protein A176_000025 [Myxococcus hansupus]